MVQLAEKEKREGTEKGYDERMDMIMEVRRVFRLAYLSVPSPSHVLREERHFGAGGTSHTRSAAHSKKFLSF